MNRSARIVVVFVLVHVLAAPRPAFADGGTVRASVRAGNWQVTVFTSPTPPRAGSIDVSVLVQDANGQPDPAARVVVRASPRGEPNRVIEQPATREAATNKLFVAAVLALPESGWWEFRVRVGGGGGAVEVPFALEVGEPPPRWLSLAGWLAWPAVAVLLFAVHRVLVRWKEGRSHSR